MSLEIKTYLHDVFIPHTPIEDILVFPYGSRVYGTSTETSDYDYISVIPNEANIECGREIRSGHLNLHFYKRDYWQDQLNKHAISCMEVYYLPDGICRHHFDFNVDLEVLRNSICSKASHSFVKAKKKIEIEKDYYIGWKSLFHSLRILEFGIQIAQGGITDYSIANPYWEVIKEITSSKRYQQFPRWEPLQVKFKPIYNSLSIKFKILTKKAIKCQKIS